MELCGEVARFKGRENFGCGRGELEASTSILVPDELSLLGWSRVFSSSKIDDVSLPQTFTAVDGFVS